MCVCVCACVLYAAQTDLSPLCAGSEAGGAPSREPHCGAAAPAHPGLQQSGGRRVRLQVSTGQYTTAHTAWERGPEGQGYCALENRRANTVHIHQVNCSRFCTCPPSPRIKFLTRTAEAAGKQIAHFLPTWVLPSLLSLEGPACLLASLPAGVRPGGPGPDADLPPPCLHSFFPSFIPLFSPHRSASRSTWS